MKELGRIERHVDLNILFHQLGIDAHDLGNTIRQRAFQIVRAIVNEYPDDEAEKLLTAVIEYVFKERKHFIEDDHELLAALRVDGFQRDDVRLVPTTPAPAAMAPELSALEQRLDELGFKVARVHYQQAHQSYVAGHWEAANGQLRSFIENLVIELGDRCTGNKRDNPAAALQDLRNQGNLDDGEWNLTRYFWSDIQDNGPHQGLSEEQEALFRLHVGTSVARYLLHKLTRSCHITSP